MDPLGGITEQTFDAVGRLETRTLPNGVVSTWTYDARGWTDTIVHREPTVDGGEVIASVDYTRSPSGEPTRIDREDGSYVLYDYDDSLRLTGEHHRDAGGGIVRNITYVYDADGNRTQRIVQVGAGASSTVEDYAYSAGDLLETVAVAGTTTADYDYDSAGRVTTITDTRTRALSWDADDHVTSLTEGPRTVRWTFDGDGRRLSRTEEVAGLVDREVGYATAPTLTESLESPHAVTDGAGNEQLGYVFAGEHPLFRFDPVTGEPVYYLQDGMGSVIGLVGDDAGTEVSTLHYDGFGNELRTTGTLATLPAASAGDFRFQGMWLDEGTGLYYVRARVYEAGTGRFLSRDPAEGRRTGPETYWAYVFAGNDPNVMRDPAGLFTLREVFVANLVQATLINTAIASVGLARRAICGRLTGRHFLEALLQVAVVSTIEAAISTAFFSPHVGVGRLLSGRIGERAFSLFSGLGEALLLNFGGNVVQDLLAGAQLTSTRLASHAARAVLAVLTGLVDAGADGAEGAAGEVTEVLVTIAGQLLISGAEPFRCSDLHD